VVTTGTTAGTSAIFLTAADPLFRDPSHRNFYLAEGSQAVNSAQDSVPDRPSLLAVKSAIGIPQSDILAPAYDLYGQFRSTSGGGETTAKDRGAIEQADTLRPEGHVFVTDTQLVDIVDNDSAHRDRNAADNDMAIRNTNIGQFVIQLSDVAGVGIDDLTVDPVGQSQFKITLEDGTLLYDQKTAAAAGRSPDYFFVYNAATDQAIFEPSSGFWPLNHTYTITLNNTPAGATDSLGNPLPTGILDLAGNKFAANRADGTTQFNIFVGILYDFGDAPDPKYPTLLASNGAAHVVQDGYHLGATVTEEKEGLQTPNADGDTGDDGVVIGNLSPNTANTTIINTITVNAVIPAGLTGKLDAWIDVNRDGDWNDPGEKLLLTNSVTGSNELLNGSNTLTFNFGNAATQRGATFARFRFSSTGSASPTGVAPDGEVEDYKVVISGPPYQNPNNRFDVNNSGEPSPADALIVINYINAFGPGPLVLGQPPIPDPSGGGLPRQGLYVDVNGDTFLSSADALDVIDYLNAHPNTGGEGEGESEAAADASAAATLDSSNAASSMIPLVLFASPSVVVEVRDRSPLAALAADQSPTATSDDSQDLALLALSSAKSTATGSRFVSSSTLKSPGGSLDEASWEDLLTSLASDQETK
jgi:hypothetical protein